MHYLALVITPLKADELERSGIDAVVETVAEMLEPYTFDEKDRDPAQYFEWDSWVIGGRWTGYFDGYDPHQDERNLVVCRICDGSGMEQEARQDGDSPAQSGRGGARQEARERYVAQTMDAPGDGDCGWCMGNGVEIEVPLHAGDFIRVSDIPNDRRDFYAVLSPDGFQNWETREDRDWATVSEMMKAMAQVDIRQQEEAEAKARGKGVPLVLDRYPDHLAVIVDYHD